VHPEAVNAPPVVAHATAGALAPVPAV